MWDTHRIRGHKFLKVVGHPPHSGAQILGHPTGAEIPAKNVGKPTQGIVGHPPSVATHREKFWNSGTPTREILGHPPHSDDKSGTRGHPSGIRGHPLIRTIPRNSGERDSGNSGTPTAFGKFWDTHRIRGHKFWDTHLAQEYRRGMSGNPRRELWDTHRTHPTHSGIPGHPRSHDPRLHAGRGSAIINHHP